MQIDSRLNDIDDCLYRVAIRVLVVQDDKEVLVKPQRVKNLEIDISANNLSEEIGRKKHFMML